MKIKLFFHALAQHYQLKSLNKNKAKKKTYEKKKAFYNLNNSISGIQFTFIGKFCFFFIKNLHSLHSIVLST